MGFIASARDQQGLKCDVNEDFSDVISISENILFACVADGCGSKPSQLQPAQIAVRHITNFIKRFYDEGKNEEYLIAHADTVLKNAIQSANDVLGAFHTANEELFPGFYCCLTCAIFSSVNSDLKFTFAHTGNTRLYLIRSGNDGQTKIIQLTKDQTEAQILVNKGVITQEQYYTHEARTHLLCPLGQFTEPQIDVFKGNFKKDSLYLLTSDGIHYAIRPESIMDLVLNSKDTEDACTNLIKGAIEQEYNDDYAAIVIRYTDETAN